MQNIKNKPMKIYFYNGMNAPKLFGNSIEEVLCNTRISFTFMGDVTAEFIEDVNEQLPYVETLADVNEILNYWDFYANPTRTTLRQANRSWFAPNELDTHLEGFC